MRSAPRRFAVVAASVAIATALGAPHASAQDLFSFFSDVFGGGRRAAPSASYAPDAPFENGGVRRESANRTSGAGTYCVRTCDGRYFPLPSAAGQSKAQTCNSFCPASETKVFYGGNIDHAVSDNGRAYSDLPNAFRFRNELVAGCTCNGKDSVGLAQIRIEDDKTVRRGDIVAGPNGLMVANGSAEGRRKSVEFSPASSSVQARFSQLPVVAAQ
ncbi:MAG: hypothetical protein A4S14_19605 [Proteobacteria bacterium SG_bin9]|nr:MAG: hypothetical protein A4S14_19605 [Proteobacteria bacterium SG_bin9]